MQRSKPSVGGILVAPGEKFDEILQEIEKELSGFDRFSEAIGFAADAELAGGGASGPQGISGESTDPKLTLDLDYDKRIGIEPELHAPEPGIQSFDNEPAPAEIYALDRKETKKVSAPTSFEWLREVVSHAEHELELKEDSKDPGEVVHDKKDLSSAERERVEPVGQFIMNFTKAILRSGYYATEHPGAVSAKHGLHEEFQAVMLDCRELMITKEESREIVDFSITGILESPVTIRTVVGQGVAELFAPKLQEYFEKKELISLAIKNEITSQHFEEFIDIMSDPKVDRAGTEKPGQILTNALVDNGINEISTVFFDDRLNLEKDLPWRVEMAMHRLAKDLKLLPMFQGIDSQSVSQVKQQSVADIIRPLRHPKLLNDFLVNCYIIARHIENMESKEIEQIIVDSFPIGMLLPTCEYTYKELDRLKALKDENPENESIDRRLSGIKRILKMVARRVVMEKTTGGQHFLAHLYDNEILSFEELPADAQYVINTRQMAGDVKADFGSYMAAMDAADDVDDIIVYLKCFRRIMPLLIEAQEWPIIIDISEAIRKNVACVPAPANLAIKKMVFETFGSALRGEDETETDDQNETVHLAIDYVFSEQTDLLIKSYENLDPNKRERLGSIFDCLGYRGVNLLGQLLAETPDRTLRGQIINWLIQKKSFARKWVQGILNEPNCKWYLYRNAILILRKVSNDAADVDSIRLFLEDANPRLRLEALSAVISLKPDDLESTVISFLADEDSRINWRAVKALGDLPSIKSSSVLEILSMISLEPKDEENASAHFRRLSLLISAINGLREIPLKARIESDILRICEKIAFKDKKWRQMLKRAVGAEDASVILKAAVPLLGRIGGVDSKQFLNKLAKSRSDLAGGVKDAIEKIDTRS